MPSWCKDPLRALREGATTFFTFLPTAASATLVAKSSLMQPRPLPKKSLFLLLLAVVCSALASAQDWTVPQPHWRSIFQVGSLDEEHARVNKPIAYGNMNDTTLIIDSIFEGKISRTSGYTRLINQRLIEVTKTLVVRGYEEKKMRILYKADQTTIHSTTETHKNPAGVVLMEETKTYEGGRVVRGNRIERNAAGGVTKRYRFNPQTQTFEEIAMNDCAPQNEFFAGYSNLTNLGENESTNLALGLHLAYAYFLTQRMALAADFSIHTRKDNDLRIMQAFLMGGLQYQLVMRQNQSKMNVLARLLAGLAMDRQKYDYGSGTDIQKAQAFVIAFGLGLNYELNRRIALGLLADYLHTRFNDDGQGSLRISAGVRINLGCK